MVADINPEPDHYLALIEQMQRARCVPDLIDLARETAPLARERRYFKVAGALCRAAREDAATLSAITSIFVNARIAYAFPYSVKISELVGLSKTALPLARRVEIMRELFDTLYIAIDVLPAAETLHRAYPERLAFAARELGQAERDAKLLALMRRLAEKAETSAAVIKIAEYFQSSALWRQQAQEILASMLERNPDDQTAQIFYIYQSASPEGLRHYVDDAFALFLRDDSHRSFNLALWRHLYYCGDWNRARVVGEKLYAAAPSAGMAINLGKIMLKIGDDQSAERYFQHIESTTISRPDDFSNNSIEILSAYLFRTFYRHDNLDHERLEADLQSNLQVLREGLAGSAMTIAELVRLANELDRREEYPFRQIAQFPERLDFQIRPEYCSFDYHAYRIVWRSLCEHLVVILERAAHLASDGSPTPSISLVAHCAYLLQEKLLLLERPQQAIAAIEPLAELVGGQFLQLVDACRLSQDATGCAGEPLNDTKDGQAYRVRPYQAWMNERESSLETLLEEEAYESEFLALRSDMALNSLPYCFPGQTIWSAPASDLTIRQSEIVITADGVILRPSAWHVDGHYPPPNHSVKLSARYGAILRNSDPTREIVAPVFVLGNNDCFRIANYFHWLMLVLTRVNLLLPKCATTGRKILMPRELRPWMQDSLKIIGARDEQFIFYDADEVLIVRDARIISPVEMAGPKSLQGLRTAVWVHMGIELDNRPAHLRPAYFLLRPNSHRRPFFKEGELAAIAQNLGYICIAPEELTITEQAHVFANAGAIAGPEGAAFANLVFCQSDLRIAQIVKEEVQMSIFPEIAMGLGQEFLWIYARTDDQCLLHRDIMNSPGRYDPDVVKAGLAWARRLEL